MGMTPFFDATLERKVKPMLRFLYFSVAVALLIALALWLSAHPGEIIIRWLGIEIKTSMALLAGSFLAVLILCVFLARSVGSVAAAPFGWFRRRREMKRRRGYQALSDGLAAASGGDAGKARKYLKTADSLLRDPALTAFLAARVATMSGDRKKASDYFQQLLNRPETAATGIKGLLEEALAENDMTQSLTLASKAFELNAHDRSLATIVFTLAMKLGDHQKAEFIIDKAKKSKILTKVEAAHWRSLILLEQARAAWRAEEPSRAADLAKAARSADPNGLGASLLLAKIRAESGDMRHAATFLEEAWRVKPVADIVDAYMALATETDPLALLRHVEKLANANKNAPESELIMGEAALAAKVWGQARTHLQKVVAAIPSRRAYILLARLEREEYQNEAAAEEWLKKSEEAPVSPQWTCAACFHPVREWTLFCPNCGEIDSLSWGTPKPKTVSAPALVS